MAIQYLKKSPKTSSTDDTKTTEIVKNLLKEIESSKEEACINLTKKFDDYDGEIIVSKEKIEKITKELDQKTVMNLKSKLLDEEIEREIVNCYINELHTLLN